MKSFFAEGQILKYNLLNYRSPASCGFNKEMASALFRPLGSGKRKALQAVDPQKKMASGRSVTVSLKIKFN